LDATHRARAVASTSATCVPPCLHGLQRKAAAGASSSVSRTLTQTELPPRLQHSRKLTLPRSESAGMPRPSSNPGGPICTKRLSAASRLRGWSIRAGARGPSWPPQRRMIPSGPTREAAAT
jgi:hypothetical protein